MEFFEKEFSQLTAEEVYEILKSRSQVFMLEQGIQCLDMDDADYRSRHFFFWEGGRVIAYLRAFPLEKSGEVKIGRVLTLTRGKGLGRILMEKSLEKIRRDMGAETVFVDAQVQAAPFYEKCGFLPISEEFIEEGVPHISMKRELCSFS